MKSNLVERRKGWNTATLKEHYDALRKADHEADKRFFHERDRRYKSERKSDEKRLTAVIRTNEKALDLLATQQKEYKESSNEWRSTLNDVVQRQITRTEVESTLSAINSKLDLTFTSINQKIDRQHTELLASINQLQQANVKEGGKDEGLELARRNQRYILGLAIAMPGLLLAIAGVAALFLR